MEILVFFSFALPWGSGEAVVYSIIEREEELKVA